MDISNLKVPPHSLQAEQAIVGALLIDPGCWDRVQGAVYEDDFYHKADRIIFRAVSKMIDSNDQIDVITVSNYLEGVGFLEDVGGLSYLGTLAKETGTSANVASYAAIVREKSLLRKLIKCAGELGEMAYAAEKPAKEIIADAESKIFEIAQQDIRGNRGFKRLKHVLGDVVEIMEGNIEKPESGVLGLSTGFDGIDEITSGLQPTDLIVVAGRPSMGKTSFAINIAEHAAIVEKQPVCVFSMEMSTNQLGMRVLSSRSSVAFKTIRESWTMGDTDWPLISSAISVCCDAPLYCDDTPALTIADVRTRCMRLTAEISNEYPNGLGLVIIDYIQLMESEAYAQGDNRNNQINAITRGLKRLAKDLSVPVIALSQLNRNVESRPNKRPMMSDLRESGGIEQDADVIAFLYRDEVYNQDTIDKDIAEVIFAKQRNGPLGTSRLGFDGHLTRFHNLINQGVGGYQ